MRWFDDEAALISSRIGAPAELAAGDFLPD